MPLPTIAAGIRRPPTPMPPTGGCELAVAHLGDARLGIPLAFVERVLQLSVARAATATPAHARDVPSTHDELLPVLELRTWLGQPARAPTPFDHLLVLRCPDGRLALEADAVTEPQPLTDADIAGAARSHALPQDGVLLLPSGLLLVPDPLQLLARIGLEPVRWVRWHRHDSALRMH